MSVSKTFAETVGGRRAWIFVHDARNQNRCSDARTPFLVAFGFGAAPSVVEAPSLLTSATGEVRWFGSIEAAKDAAREELIQQQHAAALVRQASGEHPLRPTGRYFRIARVVP